MDDLDDDAFDAVQATLDHVCGSTHGTRVLGDNRNHAINDDPKILQLTVATGLRAPYVYLPEKRIVLTHLFRKGDGRTPRAEIDKATTFLERLKTAAQTNSIQTLTDVDD